MAHTDPYRLAPPAGRGGTPAGTGRAGVLRHLLWLILVISVLGNTVASYTGAGIRVHLAAGGVTALCVILLAVPRMRRSR